MRKIPVTRNFDKKHPIGYLMLPDNIDIFPGSKFSMAFRIIEGTFEDPKKIDMVELILSDTPTPCGDVIVGRF